MGSRFRHYCALMKKNWIIWKRTLAASLCELFCPVVLMAILAIARALVEKDNVAATSNVSSTTLFAPATYLSSATNITKAMQDMEASYSNFRAFSNVSFADLSSVMTFLPKGCLSHDSTEAKKVIAYAGPDALTAPVIKQLNDTSKKTTIFNNRTLSLSFTKSLFYSRQSHYNT